MLSSTIVYLLFVAFGTMFTGQLMEAPLLLYMQKLKFTTSPESTFYIMTLAISSLVPVLCTVPFGHLSSRFGPGTTLSFCYFTVAVGVCTVILSRDNKFMFLVGYILYSITLGVRLLRFAIIGDIVEERNRTMIMAIHTFMIPAGALVAPLIWLLCQQWRQHTNVFQITFDRFSLDFSVGILSALACSAISYSKLRVTGADVSVPVNATMTENKDASETIKLENENYGSCENSSEVNNCGTLTSIETTTTTAPNKSVSIVLFTWMLLFIRLTWMIGMATFQPILIHKFAFDDAKIGKTYLLTGLISLLPPVIIVILTMVTNDRVILLLGFFLKIIGIMFYLPIFSSLGYWQVIIAYSLLAKGTMFCSTTIISLFTKVFGGSKSSKEMAYVWSVANMVPVAIQIVMANRLVGLFNTWKFGLLLIPIASCLLIVMSPLSNKYLGTKSTSSL